MHDYQNLIKSLRYCATTAAEKCETCPRVNRKECNLHDFMLEEADAIEELLAERDRYKSFFDRITDLPDCNICLKKNRCEFEPRPGEYTRINCAFCLTAPPEEDHK